jgi:hypothetical protein
VEPSPDADGGFCYVAEDEEEVESTGDDIGLPGLLYIYIIDDFVLIIHQITHLSKIWPITPSHPMWQFDEKKYCVRRQNYGWSLVRCT